MKVKNKFLFNFAATSTGGGLKRLHEYAKWFDKKGGAWFIIHPKCKLLKKELPNNKYFVVLQNVFERIFKDCDYLYELKKKIEKPELYYSYGIPIYYHFGKVNWFHLSNILPIHYLNIRLSLYDRYLRLSLLGYKIKSNFHNAAIVSAESYNSLKLIKNKNIRKTFLSLNGSDDEIKFLKKKNILKKEDFAVVVGTQYYKNIMDAYTVFENLKKKNNFLKLVIVGNQKYIAKELIKNTSVLLAGEIQQKDVIEILKKSKYYISTTSIENSFNAASEGIVFAEESYISNIGPHRELLRNECYDMVTIPNLPYKMMKIKRKNFKGKNIVSWNNIILEMIQKVKKCNLN
jgi:glycosyltransferase involved in cell wall biosynthesis